jgi:hypothetical protein
VNWNMWLRQTHRWLSIAFTGGVVVNIAALVQEKQAVWVGLLALLPLVLLMLAGLSCSHSPMPPSGAARVSRASAPKRKNGDEEEPIAE